MMITVNLSCLPSNNGEGFYYKTIINGKVNVCHQVVTRAAQTASAGAWHLSSVNGIFKGVGFVSSLEHKSDLYAQDRV